MAVLGPGRAFKGLPEPVCSISTIYCVKPTHSDSILTKRHVLELCRAFVSAAGAPAGFFFQTQIHFWNLRVLVPGAGAPAVFFFAQNAFSRFVSCIGVVWTVSSPVACVDCFKSCFKALRSRVDCLKSCLTSTLKHGLTSTIKHIKFWPMLSHQTSKSLGKIQLELLYFLYFTYF